MKKLRSIAPLLIIALCVIIIVWFLTGQKSGHTVKIADERSKSVTVTINGQDILLNTEEYDQRSNVYSLTTERPTLVSVSELKGVSIRINKTPFLSGEEKLIELDELSQTAYISVSFLDTDGNEIGSAYIQTLPDDAAPWIIRSTGTNTNVFYYFSCGNYLYKIDSLGHILYYRNCGAPTTDFRPHDVNGKRYYSFSVYAGEPSIEQLACGESERWARMVLDENYQFFDWIEFAIPIDDVGETHPIEMPFVMLDTGHYLISTIVETDWVLSSVIQETQNGKILRSWNSSDMTFFNSDYIKGVGISLDSPYYWVNSGLLTNMYLGSDGKTVLCEFEDGVWCEVNLTDGTVFQSPNGSYGVLEKNPVQLRQQELVYVFSENTDSTTARGLELISRIEIQSVFCEN